MYLCGVCVHVCMMYVVCGACIIVCMLMNRSRDRRELVVFLYGFAPRCPETETVTEWGADLSVLLAITLSRFTRLCPYILELLGCAAMPAF